MFSSIAGQAIFGWEGVSFENLPPPPDEGVHHQINTQKNFLRFGSMKNQLIQVFMEDSGPFLAAEGL